MSPQLIEEETEILSRREPCLRSHSLIVSVQMWTPSPVLLHCVAWYDIIFQLTVVIASQYIQ